METVRKSGYTEDNNISPVRQVAIDILEDLSEMLVDEGRIADYDTFDCKRKDNFWYDCEDMIVEYIEDLLVELKQEKEIIPDLQPEDIRIVEIIEDEPFPTK